MPPTRSRARRPPRSTPLLQSRDFTAYLREKSAEIAPGDVETLVEQVQLTVERGRQELRERPRLLRQLELAARLLDDHASELCPQIPYHTVSLLAVAMLYYMDPLDVIPDWLPGVGRSDDALVFELAFELGRAGIERYCAFKSIPTDGLLPTPRVAASRAARRTAPRKKR
ncbi:MAG: YkvA family protein [Candidatus Binatia bacterium]